MTRYPEDKKGFADVGIVIILGFFSVWAYKLCTFKPSMDCKKYQEKIDRHEDVGGIAKQEHFYHNHTGK